MKQVVLLLLLIFSVSIITPGYAAERQLSEKGAFLSNRADSVSDLVQQLATNKAIANRYARHFGMTPQAVSKYFEDNLKFTTLRKPLHSMIYFVSKNGVIKVGRRLLPAGSRVFTLQNGQPILEWRCGNPLVSRLPKVAAPKITTTKVTPPAISTPIVTASADETSELVTTPPVSTAVLPSLEQTSTILAPTVTGVEPIVETTAAAPVAAIPGQTLLSSAKALPLLLPLLIGGSRVFNDPKPNDVPEPAALIALSTGLGSAALAWRRRRRN